MRDCTRDAVIALLELGAYPDLMCKNVTPQQVAMELRHYRTASIIKAHQLQCSNIHQSAHSSIVPPKRIHPVARVLLLGAYDQGSPLYGLDTVSLAWISNRAQTQTMLTNLCGSFWI